MSDASSRHQAPSPTDDPATYSDPIALFGQWFAVAQTTEINDPSAASVASVDASGMPNVRMLLMKGVDARGFVFYTNFQSAKGVEILGAMKMAMNFHWKSLRRQVRARGPVEIVSQDEAEAYFSSRPRESQIGAWASDQSRPIESREALQKRVAEFTARFGDGPVPRPPHWSGFRLMPLEIEFWSDGAFRLHDRHQFSRSDTSAQTWTRRRLSP